jgi:hypothetical protein
MADSDGNIHVTPGRRIPGIPLNQGKLGFDFMPTPEWTLGLDTVAVGSHLVGDDANQNKRLSGYWLVNLHATYQMTKEAQFSVSSTTSSTAITRCSEPISTRSQSRTSAC